MKISSISLTSIPSIPELIRSYLTYKNEIKFLYNLFPTPDNFLQQIKLNVFPFEKRIILRDVLINQYKDCKTEEPVNKNINRLAETNTYTVTTGHQPNFCTGPLFVIYKIICTIKLSQVLNQKYTDYHFVPVFWMNSEDHDLDEINHIFLKGEKICWDTNQTGPTGRMQTSDISKTLELLKLKIENQIHSGFNKEVAQLLEMFYVNYTSSENLSKATIKIINHLFGKYGLVVLEPDNRLLKKIFEPVLEDELLNQNSFKYITEQNEKINNFDKPIVNPREINLFYIDDGIRERIVVEKENNIILWKVLNTNLVFTKHQVISLLKNSPEKFSPNVLLRCLYQQSILPNLGYTGGNIEISYWMQLKSLFDHYKEPLPILIPRNSFFVLDGKSTALCEKLKIDYLRFFDGIEKLCEEFIKSQDENQNNITNEKNEINQLLNKISDKLNTIDPELLKSYETEKIKINKSIAHLEDKIRKATIVKHDVTLNRIRKMYHSLFPEGKWQERKENIFFLFSVFGDRALDDLIYITNPFIFNTTFLSE